MAEGLPLPRLSRGLFPYDAQGVATYLPAGAAAPQQAAIAASIDERLLQDCSMGIAFVERTGGFSAPPYDSLNLRSGLGDDDRLVRANNAALMSAFGIDGMPVVAPVQVHGSDVLVVESDDPAAAAAAQKRGEDGFDAVVVSTPGVAGLILTADCLSVAFAAPTGALAVAHCGWRSTVAHLAAKTLTVLAEKAQCAPDQVNAYLGSCIHTECFETSCDVCALFEREFGREVLADDGRHVNLVKAVVADLEAAGLARERLVDLDVCSVCNTDRFFSYRAEGDASGRHGTFVFNVAGFDAGRG